MPVKKRIDKKRAAGVPPGVLSYLLGEPWVPAAHDTGRLQIYQHSREALLEKFWPMLTPAQRRKAARVRGEPD